MTINASHRAATVRLSHAGLLTPSYLLTIFLYNSIRAVRAHSLIPDIALTHLGLLVGTISVY
ncbi:hypothetical protein BGY98DRAFT_1030039, partial [Russula aff. rugulosa BPL654]